jgi:uncharacterized Zn finger protein
MGWGGFAPYVSVASKRAKAAKTLKKLQKSNPAVRPVVIEGSALARTWWGKSWNRNLERYADYENRIGRGRSYVRHGAVLDLRIRAGEVTALVQGSSSKPYSIKVTIKELAASRWNDIKSICTGKLASLPELLAGQFPRELGEIFMEEGKGLFPTPKEIGFSCSCPDWARLCKHVAAALYGVGARLDSDPGLFFTLRGVPVQELISAAVADKAKDLLEKAEKKSRRVLEDVNLSEVFGIDLEEPETAEVKIRRPKTTAGPVAKQAPQSLTGDSPPPAAKPAQTRTARPRAPERAAIQAKTEASPLEIIERIITRSRKGIDTAGIVKETGLEARQVRSLIQRLKMQGRIRTISRGVYGK